MKDGYGHQSYQALEKHLPNHESDNFEEKDSSWSSTDTIFPAAINTVAFDLISSDSTKTTSALVNAIESCINCADEHNEITRLADVKNILI